MIEKKWNIYIFRECFRSTSRDRYEWKRETKRKLSAPASQSSMFDLCAREGGRHIKFPTILSNGKEWNSIPTTRARQGGCDEKRRRRMLLGDNTIQFASRLDTWGILCIAISNRFSKNSSHWASNDKTANYICFEVERSHAKASFWSFQR